MSGFRQRRVEDISNERHVRFTGGSHNFSEKWYKAKKWAVPYGLKNVPCTEFLNSSKANFGL